MEKRDFTEALEQELLDYCIQKEDDPNWSATQQFGTLDIDAYQANQNDISYHMEHLDLHHAMYVEDQEYNSQWIQDVFDDVRLCDSTYAGKAESHINDVFSHYRESLNSLLDSIRVTEPGENSISVERVSRMREEYGRYGGADGQYSGIFGGVNSFNEDMSRVGDGALTPTFERLYNDGDVDWDLFDSWMLNGAYGWEIAAMSMLLDTYLVDNDQFYIDTNRFATFIDHCYIPDYIAGQYMDVDLSYDSNDPNAEITDWDNHDTYNVSPVVLELFAYRQNQSNASLAQYGAGLYDGYTTREDNRLVYDCFVSDSLLAIYTYYPQLAKYESDRGDHLLWFSMDSEGKGVTVSEWCPHDFWGDGIEKHHDCHIAFLAPSMDEAWEFVTVGRQEDGIEDPNAVVYNAGLDMFYGLLIDKAFSFGGDIAENAGAKDLHSMIEFSSNAYSYGDNCIDILGLNRLYNQTVANNTHIEQQISMTEYRGYIQSVGGTASFIQYGDEIMISNVMMDDREAAMRLAYYNSVPDNPDLTMSDLKTQLEGCTSGSDIQGLASYSNYANGEGGISNNSSDRYESCCDCCRDILALQGTPYSTATPEQIAAAYEQAVAVEDYVQANYGTNYSDMANGDEIINQALN